MQTVDSNFEKTNNYSEQLLRTSHLNVTACAFPYETFLTFRFLRQTIDLS